EEGAAELGRVERAVDLADGRHPLVLVAVDAPEHDDRLARPVAPRVAADGEQRELEEGAIRQRRDVQRQHGARARRDGLRVKLSRFHVGTPPRWRAGADPAYGSRIPM